MKRAQLFHNPGAGADDFDKEQIISMLEAANFECRYSSTDKWHWSRIDEKSDFIVIAGGDGTVRKVTEAILAHPETPRVYPIGLLPFGTANNIAQTLSLKELEAPYIINEWHKRKLKSFDVGNIDSDKLKQKFFLESLGFGIFPYLMIQMDKKKKEVPEEPSEKIQMAREVLKDIVFEYEPRHCQLVLDGVDYSGSYLLVEIMNTQSIGPNLCLAPDGDPGDGIFDVVLVPESDKEKFYNYVLSLSLGNDVSYSFRIHPARQIQVSWDGPHTHVDDEVVTRDKSGEISITIRERLLQFLIA